MGGSTPDINKYRPISLFSILDKIIEKLIHVRLYNFLQEHEILHPNQFGFRKNNSTVYVLSPISEMVKCTIDSEKFGCGIFVDLRKAFDTVNNEILLNKLEHYGIRDNMFKCFQSNFTGRKQFVSFNGQSSDLLLNNCGVPQGSVLQN